MPPPDAQPPLSSATPDARVMTVLSRCPRCRAFARRAHDRSVARRVDRQLVSGSAPRRRGAASASHRRARRRHRRRRGSRTARLTPFVCSVSTRPRRIIRRSPSSASGPRLPRTRHTASLAASCASRVTSSRGPLRTSSRVSRRLGVDVQRGAAPQGLRPVARPRTESAARARASTRSTRRGTPAAAYGATAILGEEWARTIASTASAWRSIFTGPTPGTPSSASRVDGSSSAIACSVESWKMTNAGTLDARARPRRHSTSAASTSGCAASAPRSGLDDSQLVARGVESRARRRRGARGRARGAGRGLDRRQPGAAARGRRHASRACAGRAQESSSVSSARVSAT